MKIQHIENLNIYLKYNWMECYLYILMGSLLAWLRFLTINVLHEGACPQKDNEYLPDLPVGQDGVPEGEHDDV